MATQPTMAMTRMVLGKMARIDSEPLTDAAVVVVEESLVAKVESAVTAELPLMTKGVSAVTERLEEMAVMAVMVGLAAKGARVPVVLAGRSRSSAPLWS